MTVNPKDFNLNHYIVAQEKTMSSNHISISYFEIEGPISLKNIKEYIDSHLLKIKENKIGFEKKYIFEENKKLIVTYSKTGNRTYRFPGEGILISKTLNHITDIVELYFEISDENCIKITIIGGNEQFIDFDVKSMLNNISEKYNSSFNRKTINQDFMKKMCLTLHNQNVKKVELDTSKSKTFSEEVDKIKINKEINFYKKQELNKLIFHGDDFLRINVVKDLINEEINKIDIIMFNAKKVKLNIHGKDTNINYTIKSEGRITFSFSNEIKNKMDENSIAQVLLKKLKEISEQKTILNNKISNINNNPNIFTTYKKDIFNKLQDSIFNGDCFEIRDYLDKLSRFLRNKNETLNEKELIILKCRIKDLVIQELDFQILSKSNTIKDMLFKLNFNEVELEELQKTLSEKDLDYINVFISFFNKTTVNALLDKERISKFKFKKPLDNAIIEKNSQKKGLMLESLIESIFKQIKGFKFVAPRIKNKTEEIDLVFLNESEDPFWKKRNSHIFIECKNQKEKSNKKDLIIFKDKMENDSLCDFGIFIALEGFTNNLDTFFSKNQKCPILPLSKIDLYEYFNSNIILSEFIKHKSIKFITKKG